MLKSLVLHFTETGNLDIPTKGITVFVGPNNAGKSLVLREIEASLEQPSFPSGLRILKDYDIIWPSQIEVEALIDASPPITAPGQDENQFIVSRLNPNGTAEDRAIYKDTFRSISEEKTNKHWMANAYTKIGMLRLDGRSRFTLKNDQIAGDLSANARNMLAFLFKDDSSRQQVRDFIYDAFGKYFVIDPTNLGNLRIKLSAAPPTDDEQSLNANARQFHNAALHISEASDGVQAFTGIVSAVCSGKYHTVLIDEPEAFLHPPLARKLGRNLSSLMTTRQGSLLASTHSSDFLMGCIQASSEVRVVRLEYSNGKSRARSIDPKKLEAFLRKPLMRSANVISGLFHDGVIITESDNDRAFYSEIYHRLSVKSANFPSILFVNAQNKQTIKEIMGPLRAFGVPAAAIPDIDILKDGGKTWTDWLAAGHIPSALHLGYGQQRSAIQKALVATGKDMKNDGGIDILNDDDRSGAEHLFENLEAYGIFPVRHGELENWLPMLKIAGKKTDWTVSILERLGNDPADCPPSALVGQFEGLHERRMVGSS